MSAQVATAQIAKEIREGPDRFNAETGQAIAKEPPKERAKFAKAIFNGLRNFSGRSGNAVKKRAIKRIEELNINEQKFQDARAARRLNDRLESLKKYGPDPYRTRAGRFALKYGTKAGKRFAKTYFGSPKKTSAKRTGKSGYPSLVFPDHYGKPTTKGNTWKKLEWD